MFSPILFSKTAFANGYRIVMTTHPSGKTSGRMLFWIAWITHLHGRLSNNAEPVTVWIVVWIMMASDQREEDTENIACKLTVQPRKCLGCQALASSQHSKALETHFPTEPGLTDKEYCEILITCKTNSSALSPKLRVCL